MTTIKYWEIFTPNGEKHFVSGKNAADARKNLRSILGLGKLPKGTITKFACTEIY